jgi:hypothetical protein
LKRMLETDNENRRAILAGAPLKIQGGIDHLILSRTEWPIILPQYADIEFTGAGSFDMTQLTNSSAPTMFTYTGRFGPPSRPVNADYLKDSSTSDLVAGEIARLDLKKGDRVLWRATESLTDLVGAFTREDDVDASQPATSNFYAAGNSYAPGAGAINPGDGFSYRYIGATNPYIAPANFDPTQWILTGKNAKAEDRYIDGFDGDTVRWVDGLRYDYPLVTRPIITKYLDQGKHKLRNWRIDSNDPGLKMRGAYAANTLYSVGEMVDPPSGGGSRPFRVLVTHTSPVGTPDSTMFLAEVAAGNWQDMGSDRLVGISMSNEVYIDGGDIRGMSGMAFRMISNARFKMTGMRGHLNTKRGTPGGFLFLGGAFLHAMVNDFELYGGSQPLMLSASGGHYGVSIGAVFCDGKTLGGNSGPSQHNMNDGTVYRNIDITGTEYESSPGVLSGGSGLDIRTPSEIDNVRISGFKLGRAMVLRSQFMSRDGIDKRGTTIRGLKVMNCLSGIRIDNGETAIDYRGAGGMLNIDGAELRGIGGSGSAGALELISTIKTLAGGVPVLPKLSVRNTIIEMIDATAAIRLSGPWRNPVIQAEIIGSGTGRSLLVDAGDGESWEIPEAFGSAAINPDFDIKQGFTYAELSTQFVTGDMIKRIRRTEVHTSQIRARATGFELTRADLTLTPSQRISNEGATGNINFILPAAVQGDEVIFFLAAAQPITIIADAADQFSYSGGTPGALGGSITAAAGWTVGRWIKVTAVTSTLWVATGSGSSHWTVA